MERKFSALIIVILLYVGTVNAQEMPLLSRYYWSHWDAVKDVAVEGDYVFAAVSNAGLTVLNIEDIERPQVVSWIDFEGLALDVELSGNLAFVRTTLRIEIVDRSNIENLQLLGSIEGAFDDMEIVGDVIYLSRRYVWYEEWYGGQEPHYVARHYGYDISNPASPRQFWYQAPEFRDHSLTLLTRFQDYLYVIGNGCLIYDIRTRPPTQVGATRIGYRAMDYCQQDSILFAADWEGHIDIVSFGDPIHPRQIYFDVVPDEGYYCYNHVAVFESTLYLNGIHYFQGGSLDAIFLFDVNDLEHPVRSDSLVGQFNFLKIFGEKLYTGTGTKLQIYDLSQDGTPELITEYSDDAFVIDVETDTSYAYVTVDGKGCSILDIRDVANPEEVARVELAGKLSQADLLNDLLAIVGDSTLTFVDVEDPVHPQVLSVSTVSNSANLHGVKIADGYAYVCHNLSSNQGAITTLNIQNPREPEVVSVVQENLRAWATIQNVSVERDNLYVVNATQYDGATLRVLNLRNPENPDYVTSYGGMNTFTICANDSFMYTYDKVTIDIGDGHPTHIEKGRIWNISNFGEPRQLNRHSDVTKGYISYFRGMEIFSIGSQISVLHLSGDMIYTNFDMLNPGIASSVAFTGDKALIAERSHFAIYDISQVMGVEDVTPSIPSEFEFTAFPNPFNGTITIDYSLPHASRTKISLHSIDGRLVETVFDGESMSGAHRINWSGGELANGIYLCRISARGLDKTMKIVLMK